MSDKESLIGLSRDELAARLTGAKSFAVKQLWNWIYCHGARDFDRMTNLSKDLRTELAERFTLDRIEVLDSKESRDGTRKWLFGLAGEARVESVFIPETDRGALCVSSQAGCALACAFCRTGAIGFKRNLTAREIVGQLMTARDAYDEWDLPSEQSRLISNVVFMGMGEPLLNADAVRRSAAIMLDPEGLAMSKRRITLSTSGVAPEIPGVADIGVKLAVSLHAATDELRSTLMPVNKKYPLAELMAACRAYQRKIGRNHITFEYVLLRDVNDSPADARELLRLVKGIDAKFNLIPFNPWEGSEYEPSAPAAVGRFAGILAAAGIAAPVRVPRGQDIAGACGQLAGQKPEGGIR